MTTPQPSKTCLLTIGATASFSALIRAALTPAFLSALHSHGYTELIVQYGQDGQALFEQRAHACADALRENGVEISGFELDKAGLGRLLRVVKGGQGAREGVVVSHAGSGTILDALRCSVPIVVVPNPELLDNHQVELAEALAEQEYVVHGKIEALGAALQEAEVLRSRQREWPPVNSGKHRGPTGLKGVLDDEMGFVD